MLKRSIFIVFSIFFLLSCNDSPTKPENIDSFFPNKLGSKWYYKQYYTNYDSSIAFYSPDLEFDMITEVTGEKTIDGYIYTVFETKYFDRLHFRPRITYCRMDDNKLYIVIKQYSSDEYILFSYVDFSTEKGDTFTFKWLGFDFIGRVTEKYSDFIKIHYFIPGGADEDYECTYKKNIGLVKSFSTDFRNGYFLVKYELR